MSVTLEGDKVVVKITEFAQIQLVTGITDLDGLPDGSTFVRIRATEMTSGKVSSLGRGSDPISVTTSGLDTLGVGANPAGSGWTADAFSVDAVESSVIKASLGLLAGTDFGLYIAKGGFGGTAFGSRKVSVTSTGLTLDAANALSVDVAGAINFTSGGSITNDSNIPIIFTTDGSYTFKTDSVGAGIEMESTDEDFTLIISANTSGKNAIIELSGSQNVLNNDGRWRFAGTDTLLRAQSYSTGAWLDVFTFTIRSAENISIGGLELQNGNLNLRDNIITTSDSNTNITLTPTGTGKVDMGSADLIINSVTYSYPSISGSPGFVLTTDGQTPATLTWANAGNTIALPFSGTDAVTVTSPIFELTGSAAFTGVGANSAYVFNLTNTSSTGTLMSLIHSGTGNSKVLDIVTDATGAIPVSITANSLTGGANALQITTSDHGVHLVSTGTTGQVIQSINNAIFTGTTTVAANYFALTNASASASGTLMYLAHAGTSGAARLLELSHTGTGPAFIITSASAVLDSIVGYTFASMTGGVGQKITANALTSGLVYAASTSSTAFTGFGMYHGTSTGNNGAVTGAIFHANISGALSNAKGLRVVNAGVGNGVFLDQNGNGIALNIDSESSTANVISVTSTATSGIMCSLTNTAFIAGGTGLLVSSVGAGGTASTSLLKLQQTNASSSAALAFLNQDGNGISINIDSEATSVTVFNLVAANTSGTAMVVNNAGVGGAIVDFQDGGTSVLTAIDGGLVGVGIAAPVSKLHVDQASATGAIPVLTLDQGDVSEEMMEFLCTIGTGNAIEAVGAKSLTTTHFIKVTITGGLTRYIPVGTIA